MADWLTALAAQHLVQHRAVMVSVVASYGSAPREPGARMVVTMEAVSGTIGGGALEYQAIADAKALLQSGGAAFVRDYALGPKLDQCCGGRVMVLFDLFTPDEAHTIKAAQGDGSTHLITKLGCDAPHIYCQPDDAKALVKAGKVVALLDKAGKPHGDMRVDVADVGAVVQVLGSPYAPLYMFGAGHVGRAVARILSTLPFDVTWIDSRAEAFPPSPIEGVRRLVTQDPVAVVESAPKDALYLVFTHSHPLDFDITAAILKRGDAAYCGLIGSETKRSRFLKRFRDDVGLDETQIGRLTCPIGLGGPQGKEPEVIAIAVAAELLDMVRSLSPITEENAL
ncbi:xanthine dehydrogenase accessory protein XdhC [Iodidimonas muriae]|uniref:Xanthine dehydrogenase accessory protein XdhC n=1 Tax=Iodidimonas muriae TaxID=261467 RepID=A0ABQ2LFW0_9PROT|nr:xanthine dehydrogenase accessory protein XdhC [Iodidimonas muriae]GER08740.1 xanthine dehydrogenase accessory protein XdhC [Kordiimonadales bacterium JCM 17843]GGO16488.1 xanthine dehydrogenase accessory protein XdhC [Iodidimonas muriae]